jgi:hypothetical protein
VLTAVNGRLCPSIRGPSVTRAVDFGRDGKRRANTVIAADTHDDDLTRHRLYDDLARIVVTRAMAAFGRRNVTVGLHRFT